jgi:hypothetical protein
MAANSKSTSKNRPAGNLIPRQPYQSLTRFSGAAGKDVKVNNERTAGSFDSPADGALSLPHGSSADAGVSLVNAQANGDESDARIARIEEILAHAAMPLLDKCELVAEWVHYAEARVSGQPVHKPQGGRPEGGVARAARELPVPGKTPEARRKFVERAIKITSIWPEAKAEARTAGLDDTQSALLAIAQAHSLEAQLAKLQEIAAGKTQPRRGGGGSTSNRAKAEVEQLKAELAAANERERRLEQELESARAPAACAPKVDGPIKVPPTESDMPALLDQLSAEDQLAYDAIKVAWSSHVQPLWHVVSVIVHERFIAALRAEIASTNWAAE